MLRRKPLTLLETHGGGLRNEKISRPRIDQIGNVLEWEGRANRKNTSRFRVFNPKGLAPCLNCCEGGNIMPFIMEHQNGKDRRKETENDDAPNS